MAKVVAYTVDYCPYCKKAKALFNQKGIDFEDIDITDNEDEMREKLEKTERKNKETSASRVF